MENTQRFNTNLVTIPKSAFFIEKVHRCADCPIRQLAIKHPKSIFASLHIWHKTWWPGWKAHQARACAFAAGAGARA
ncbi:MAG: hypothetical protein NTY79_04710 [Chloroflexi bacterium]|nr:hypothetical protein [Chloroflexota bacterium]